MIGKRHIAWERAVSEGVLSDEEADALRDHLWTDGQAWMFEFTDETDELIEPARRVINWVIFGGMQ